MTTIAQFPLPYLLVALCLLGLHPSASAQTLSTGGFVSVGYLESSHYNYLADTENGTSDFVEIGLNASWTVANRTTVNGQAFVFELGPYGNYEPLVDYLFLDYRHSTEFGVQVGRIKREFGIYSHIQDIDIARTSIILPHGVYDPRYRAFSASLDGAAVYGSLNLPGDQRLSYNIYGGDIDIEPAGGLAGFSLTAISRVTVDNRVERIKSDKNAGAQIWYHPGLEGLRIGYAVSYYNDTDVITKGAFPKLFPDPTLAGQEITTRSDSISFTNDQLSIEYYFNNWTLAGEYHRSRSEMNLLQTIGPVTIVDTVADSEYTAWYLSASRRIGKLELGITYTKMPEDSGTFDFGNATFQNDRQASARYDVNEHWTLKLEAHSFQGTKRLFNQYGQNPLLDQQAWTLWAAKSTFSF